MGPCPRSARGKRFILVATDMFSRWTEAFPITSATLGTIAPTLEREVFLRWGFPRVVLTDNGPQFRGRRWTKICEGWEVRRWTTPIYHPRANPVERRNQELKKGLRLRLKGATQQRWDQFVPEIVFNMRRRRNAATGQTPAKLLLGRNLARPGETPESSPLQLPLRIEAAREHQARYGPQRPPRGPDLLHVGDLVYVRNHEVSKAAEKWNAGLAPRWADPAERESPGGRTRRGREAPPVICVWKLGQHPP
jgi:transposase